jgi:hypothetical protein
MYQPGQLPSGASVISGELQAGGNSTLIKNKTKFSSYNRKFRGIGCKVIYD